VGKSPSDIIGIGIISESHCYAWYKDATASIGTSRDLDKYRKHYKYSLPPGKSPSDIVGIGMVSGNYCYAWYQDGTVSRGTSEDLDKYRKPYEYSLPPGKSPSDIVGMGIASDNHCYAWYRDGTVSGGTSRDLDRYRKPHQYYTRLLLTKGEIKAMLKSELGDKLNKSCRFLFADGTYYCSPRADIDKLMNASSIDKNKWIREKHDCDDFSLSLKYEAIKDAYLSGARRYPHSLGILWGTELKEGSHAINFTITDNKEVLFIEPQDDKIFAPRKEDKGIHFIYL
jgi:hypothetical protein